MERIIINEQAMENAATQIDTATEQIRNLLNSRWYCVYTLLKILI